MVCTQKHNSDTETWLRKLKIHFMSINNKKNKTRACDFLLSSHPEGWWASSQGTKLENSGWAISREQSWWLSTAQTGALKGGKWAAKLQATSIKFGWWLSFAQPGAEGCWAAGVRQRAGLESTGNYVQNVLLLARKRHFGQNTCADVKRTSLNWKTLWYHLPHSILFKTCFSRCENTISVKTNWPVWQAHHSTAAPLITLAAFHCPTCWAKTSCLLPGSMDESTGQPLPVSPTGWTADHTSPAPWC